MDFGITKTPEDWNKSKLTVIIAVIFEKNRQAARVVIDAVTKSLKFTND